MFFAEQTGKHNYFTHCFSRSKLFCIFLWLTAIREPLKKTQPRRLGLFQSHIIQKTVSGEMGFPQFWQISFCFPSSRSSSKTGSIG